MLILFARVTKSSIPEVRFLAMVADFAAVSRLRQRTLEPVPAV